LNHEDDLTKVALEENIVKFAIYFRKQMAEASAHYFDVLPKHLAAVVSGVSWIDVANGDANKGAALKSIQEQYHISQEESMAFGDYFNDVEMLQQCKYSYAMENAHPEVKKKANFLTSSNDADGVMKILRTI
jgi:HAD superfamily hydrolase (TIGR01484 family)